MSSDNCTLPRFYPSPAQAPHSLVGTHVSAVLVHPESDDPRPQLLLEQVWLPREGADLAEALHIPEGMRQYVEIYSFVLDRKAGHHKHLLFYAHILGGLEWRPNSWDALYYLEDLVGKRRTACGAFLVVRSEDVATPLQLLDDHKRLSRLPTLYLKDLAAREVSTYFRDYPGTILEARKVDIPPPPRPDSPPPSCL